MAEGLKLCNQLWEQLKQDRPELDHPLAYTTLLALVYLLDTDPGYWEALQAFVNDDRIESESEEGSN